MIPTNTLFLTFGSPDLPKEITVGYLRVKVALFVPNPMRCFNCNKSGRTSQLCKVAAKCPDCGKDKPEGRCEGPKLCSNCNGPHASWAKDCPVWQKEKEIQRIRVEKRISFAEARQLVEAKMPTVITGGKTYTAAASTRRESKSVECQTSLTCFLFLLQNVRLGRLSLTSVLLADPDRYRPALRLPPRSRGWYRPTPGFRASPLSVIRRRIGFSQSSQNGLRGSANPHKMASKCSAAPSKNTPQGSAGPLKTAASKDDSSSLRCSPTNVRVDVEGFSQNARFSLSSSPLLFLSLCLSGGQVTC